jgi:hypothetical protein
LIATGDPQPCSRNDCTVYRACSIARVCGLAKVAADFALLAAAVNLARLGQLGIVSADDRRAVATA